MQVHLTIRPTLYFKMRFAVGKSLIVIDFCYV